MCRSFTAPLPSAVRATNSCKPRAPASKLRQRNKFELFDLLNDPASNTTLRPTNRTLLPQMKSAYETWFRDVSATRGYDPPAIHVGTANENPLRLSRQDLRGFGPREPGYWRVQVEAGNYRVRLLLAATGAAEKQGAAKKSSIADKRDAAQRAIVVCGKEKHIRDMPSGQTGSNLRIACLSPEASQIQAWAETDGGALQEVRYVELHGK